MRALLLVVLTLVPVAARAAGELTVYGIRQDPVGRIADFVEGSWGGGSEVLLAGPERVEGLHWGLGGDYVSLHSQTTGTTQRNEDYFRFFGGARVHLLAEKVLHPYAEAHVSLVRHAVTTKTGTGIGVATDGFRSWGPGYDLGVGLRLCPWERWVGFVGARWLQSFGLEGEGANSDVKVDPAYWNFYGGLGWTFGYLEVVPER